MSRTRTAILAAMTFATVTGVAMYVLVPALTARGATSTAAQAARLSHQAVVRLARPDRPHFAEESPVADMTDSATEDSFWIEKRSGKVRVYTNTKAYEQRGKGPSRTDSFIRGLAADYVKTAYNADRLTRMQRTYTRYVGGEETDCIVEYREYLDGVPTFNMIRITYSEDGLLLNCALQDEEVVVDRTPAISKDTAIAVAEQQSGWKKRATERASLRVVRDLDGSQRLIWQVNFTTGNAEFGGTYETQVDADTGEVVQWSVGA